MDERDDLRPPWDAETVAALNRWQTGRAAFTCPYSPHGDRRKQVLEATADGWICPDKVCVFTEDWAHPFMVEPPDLPRPGRLR